MARLTTVGLLMALLVSQAFSANLMIFSGNMTCRLEKQFEYYLVVEEEDWLWKNHLLSSFLTYGQYHTSPYNVSAVCDDDGWFDPTFEISLRVIHNCYVNRPHKYLDYKLPIFHIPINHGTHWITQNLDLTEKGTRFFGTIEEDS